MAEEFNMLDKNTFEQTFQKSVKMSVPALEGIARNHATSLLETLKLLTCAKEAGCELTIKEKEIEKLIKAVESWQESLDK